MKTFSFTGVPVEVPDVYDDYPLAAKEAIDTWVASLHKKFGNRLLKVRITRVARKFDPKPQVYGMYCVAPSARKTLRESLAQIQAAHSEYKAALAAREHGLVAAHRFIDKVEEILG